ncbi:glycosyltransferase family 4 protein [Carnobacterium pleistocenium]|uniref:glycosyltransferase family 4 protein n=1 Tax=Carnobacterium pleistocenium TaxID=181073 RepID=UPI0005542C00|nr:glycosyltransferase family 4 protein [Carnobacterium pleistocenium]
MDKVLILASIAPMIEGFNIPNIDLLQKEKYEVHVLANFKDENTEANERNNRFRNQLELKGVIVFDVPINRDPFKMTNYKAYKKIKQIIDHEGYSFIHCHSPIGGVLSRLAAREARGKNTKVVYTAHGFHFFKGAPMKNWLMYYSVEKWLARYTDCLITINEEDYHAAHNKHFKTKKIEKINGVGIDKTKYKPIYMGEKNQRRSLLGYKKDDFLLIYVGELSKRKNQQLAISMMKKVVQKIPQAKLLLVGDGESREKCTQQINDLQLEKNVFLLGFRTDVDQLMSISDIVLSTSKQEGLPVNVLEAMGTGLPIIATDCRGNRDLIHHGKNGYLVGLEEGERLAGYVDTLYHSSSLREAFGLKSLEYIGKYSVQSVMKQMTQIYQSVNYPSDPSLISSEKTVKVLTK